MTDSPSSLAAKHSAIGQLAGVHHTARPTWKLAETVRFYRDVMGLELCHAITAKGWGPADHPDFIHFFFTAGQGSTIAFFYYLNTDRPPEAMAFDHWLYRSVHTAWRVETRDALLQWKARFEKHGVEVTQVPHEILESIYVTDPNGYMVELTWQMREMQQEDSIDAALTLDAAITFEAQTNRRAQRIEEIWLAKGQHVDQYLRQDT